MGEEAGFREAEPIGTEKGRRTGAERPMGAERGRNLEKRGQ